MFEGRRKYGGRTGREAGNHRSKFSGQTLPHSPTQWVALLTTYPPPLTMSHKIRGSGMLTTALETGEGPGDGRSLQASLLSTISHQVASALEHEHVHLQSEASRSWRIGLLLTLMVTLEEHRVLPPQNGYLVLPGTIKTSGSAEAWLAFTLRYCSWFLVQDRS